MHLKKDDLIKKYNLFVKKSFDFDIEPIISSFNTFEEYYNSNKKISITHTFCKSSFLISLKEWDLLNKINNDNKEDNSFTCIDCNAIKKINLPNCRIKDKYIKFQEFSKHFKIIPEINSFKEYEKFFNLNIKIQVTHLKCNKTNNITLNDWRLLNNKNKHFKDSDYSHLCLDCAEDKNSIHVGWRWQKKYNKFKNISEGFTFSPSINNAKEYLELYDKEILVTHIACNRTSSIILKKWVSLHAVNKSVHIANKNLIMEDRIYLCPACSQEERNKQYQNQLNETYNNEFLLVENFNGSRAPVTLHHTKCGGNFEIIPENYRNRVIKCKSCGKKTSNFEECDIANLNKKLKLYLKENNLLQFTPLSDCKGLSKQMKFKNKICGHIIERSPASLVKFADKDYCPECLDLRFKSNNQEDRNSYFQDKLNEIHGINIYTLISDYDGQGTDIRVRHSLCGNEIDVYSETIRKETYKCPYCESENLKHSNYISLSQKMELYEKDANYQYKILTPFVHLKETITVKHLKCGTVFEVIGNTFKKAKYKEICPTCRRESRLNHALDILKRNHGDNYILLNPEDFESTIKPLKFQHKCGAVVEKTFSSLRNSSTEYCNKCSDKIDTTAKLRNYTFNRFKGEYIVLGEYIKSSFPIKFRHKKCGRIFQITSKEFQNRKIPCPHCSKENASLSIKEAQERVDKKFGNLFKLCGQYKNAKTEMTVMCNNCSHIFPSKLVTLLAKSRCPSCKEKFK